MINLYYIWWPLCTVILYGIHAYASFLNKGASGYKQFISVWLISVLISPLWIIISRISKNLTFDAMLFDIILFFTYTAIFCILEKQYENFALINYGGILLVILGMIMVKQ